MNQKPSIHPRTVKIAGWKGKSGIEIKSLDDRFKITEYRKDKKTSEVKETNHYIPVKNAKVMWQLIKKTIPILPSPLNKNPRYSMSYIDSYNAIKKYYNFPITRDNFNGGQNRQKYYFPYYYYPVKILEHYNAVNYYGDGSIQRLVKNWSP